MSCNSDFDLFTFCNLLSFEKFTERKKQKAVYQEPSYLTENLKLGNRRIGNREQIHCSECT